MRGSRINIKKQEQMLDPSEIRITKNETFGEWPGINVNETMRLTESQRQL